MRGTEVQNGTGKRRILMVLLLPLCLASAGAQAKPAEEKAANEGSVLPSAKDRQKAMQEDMDRLLQLARQLKAEVDSSRKDELSMKVIRDAEEIEKLARSARGRIH